MSANTCVRLASDFKNIIAVKEASGNFEQIMQIRKNAPSGFLVISGDDAITMPLLACGIDGVISVAANAYPKEFSDMVRAGMTSDFTTARALHYPLLDPIQMMFAEGSPAGVKAFLTHKGLVKNILRLPCYEVSEMLFSKIGNYLK